MTQTLQVLQVFLFAIPILTLAAVGIAILYRAVSIINRRWFLAVLIPFLLANTLTIIIEPAQGTLDWRTWLILGANLVLILGAMWASHGFQVYGLDAQVVEQVLAKALKEQGFNVSIHSQEKQDLWGRSRDTRILTALKADHVHRFWVTTRFNEVLMRSANISDTKYLRSSLPVLQGKKVTYDFKAHAAGVLYIVLALVLGVLTWIFFFEPRFILID
ncbi:MAG: hypothetical protein ACNA70_08700 [Brevefilum sp.]